MRYLVSDIFIIYASTIYSGRTPKTQKSKDGRIGETTVRQIYQAGHSYVYPIVYEKGPRQMAPNCYLSIFSCSGNPWRLSNDNRIFEGVDDKDVQYV